MRWKAQTLRGRSSCLTSFHHDPSFALGALLREDDAVCGIGLRHKRSRVGGGGTKNQRETPPVGIHSSARAGGF